MPSKKSAANKPQPTSTRKRTASKSDLEKGSAAKRPSKEETILSVAPGQFSSARCGEWFGQYAMEGKGALIKDRKLDQSGLHKLFSTIGLPDNDIVGLLISKKLDLKKLDEKLTFASWMKVMTELECDSNEKLTARVDKLRKEAKSRDMLLTLCPYAFNLAKDPGEKFVRKETATMLFALLLGGHWAVFPEFSKYFETSDQRSVTLDTLRGCCDLACTYPTLDSLKKYDAEQAWPSLADDFVESVQKSAEV